MACIVIQLIFLMMVWSLDETSDPFLFVYLFHEDLQLMSIQIVLPLLSSLLWRPLRGAYPDSSKLFHLPRLFVETVLLCDTVVIVLIPFLVANKQQRSTQKLNFEQFQHFTWIWLGTTGETCLFNPTHCLPLVWPVFFVLSRLVRLILLCNTAAPVPPFARSCALCICETLAEAKVWQPRDSEGSLEVFLSLVLKGHKRREKNPPISAFSTFSTFSTF